MGERTNDITELITLGELTDAELFIAALDITNLLESGPTQDLLRRRHFLAVIACYGSDVGTSYKWLENARKSTDMQSAIVKKVKTKEIIGIATQKPHLEIERQTIPFPPVISREIDHIAFHVPTRGPNISGWVRAEEPQDVALGEVYEKMMAGHAYGWTIEPVDSLYSVKAGIQAAGFVAEEFGRYDDQESKWLPPPMSILYTARR